MHANTYKYITANRQIDCALMLFYIVSNNSHDRITKRCAMTYYKYSDSKEEKYIRLDLTHAITIKISYKISNIFLRLDNVIRRYFFLSESSVSFMKLCNVARDQI